MSPPAAADKLEVRRWAKSLPTPPDLDERSARIVEGIVRWLPEAPPGVVLLYLPMDGEPDVSGVASVADRACAVTRTPDAGPLTVHPLDSPMETHRFGYQQPAAGSPMVDASAVGVVLVPGVVFDGAGGRLGHGKGYYDTLLVTMPEAARVGITMENRLVEKVPTEPHDVPMTHLATESGVELLA